MAAETSSLPYNSEVLRWARTFARLTVHKAAKKAATSPENIEAWEEGVSQPTVRQGRLLAKAYDRSFMEFFRASLPPVDDTQLVPDFRLHRHVPKPEESRELRKLQRWAEGVRNSALDLFDIVGEQVPVFPVNLFATTSSNAEASAAEARAAIGFTVRDQINLPSASVNDLPKKIRNSIERLGILERFPTGMNRRGFPDAGGI